MPDRPHSTVRMSRGYVVDRSREHEEALVARTVVDAPRRGLPARLIDLLGGQQ